MKNILKYLAVLISSLLLSLGNVSAVFAQAETEGVVEDAEIAIQEEERIQYEYIIFVHEDCSHCKAVEAFVEQYGIQDNIIFKQLKDNDENMELLEQYWADFEIEGGYGWPMLVRLGDNPTYSLGDTPSMEVLATDLGLDYEIPETAVTNGETEEDERDTTGDKIFLYIGGIFVLGIIGYGLYSLFIED